MENFEKLDKMDKFLEKYNFWKLTLKKKSKWSLLIIEEIE